MHLSEARRDPARTSFWENAPADGGSPASTADDNEGVSLQSVGSAPAADASTGLYDELPLIKDGVMAKLERGKIFGVEVNLDTSGSRYFRLHPDGLEYYKSKSVFESGGTAAAKGVWGFGDIKVFRPSRDDDSGRVLEVVMQSWYRSPDRVYRLRADDKAASLAWQRCMSSAMEQYSRFGAWADRDAPAKAQFFEQVSAASVVSGASAKPLSAKFAPKFKVRPHRLPN